MKSHVKSVCTLWSAPSACISNSVSSDASLLFDRIIRARNDATDLAARKPGCG